MKAYLLIFGISFSGAIHTVETMRVINNTDQPLHIDYELPIYNRADTEIRPILSQQELQDLLHEAILSNSANEIMKVVKAGANVNFFKDGKTPLKWATDLKKLNSAEVLKRCGAIIPCPQNMLFRAILNDSPEEIKHAIQAGADPKYGIARAVEFARPNAIQTLLDCGAKASIGQGLKSLAIGDIKSALLLFKNTPVSKDSLKELLDEKCDHRHILEYIFTRIDPTGIHDLLLDLVQAIIDHGYDINSTAYKRVEINRKTTQVKSAWIDAICSRFYSVEMLKLFMKNGANPNQLIYDTSATWTPLFIAIQANNLSAVKYLLEVGANIHQQCAPIPGRRGSGTQMTPLAYAQSLKNIDNHEIIDQLMHHKMS